MIESKQQVKLLQWLAVALFFQFIYLNVFKYANLLQDILVYGGAYLKSLSFYKEKTPYQQIYGLRYDSYLDEYFLFFTSSLLLEYGFNSRN